MWPCMMDMGMGRVGGVCLMDPFPLPWAAVMRVPGYVDMGWLSYQGSGRVFMLGMVGQCHAPQGTTNDPDQRLHYNNYYHIHTMLSGSLILLMIILVLKIISRNI